MESLPDIRMSIKLLVNLLLEHVPNGCNCVSFVKLIFARKISTCLLPFIMENTLVNSVLISLRAKALDIVSVFNFCTNNCPIIEQKGQPVHYEKVTMEENSCKTLFVL